MDFASIFAELKFDNLIKSGNQHEFSYFFIISSLCEKEDDNDRRHVLLMLLKAFSIKLSNPESTNCPFSKPFVQCSYKPEVFSDEELNFYESILSLSDDAWFIAHLSDILWLNSKRSSKSRGWAGLAIDSYTKNEINYDLWISYQANCFERAIRLCLQLKDENRLNFIKEKIISKLDNCDDSDEFLVLWLSKLLVKTDCTPDNFIDFFNRIEFFAKKLIDENKYFESRSFLELAIKIASKFKDNSKWLELLSSLANTYECEGDSRFSNSSAVANSFYNNAIEAYRVIPKKFRHNLNIDENISNLMHKISLSGSKIIDELQVISTEIDIRDIVEFSIDHVSRKSDPHKAILFFCGLNGNQENKLNLMRAEAADLLNRSPIHSLMGSVYTSRDGRVIGKFPDNNINKNSKFNDAIERKLIENYLFSIDFFARTSILPALGQLVIEHDFSREYLESLCFHSPLVPNGREKNLGFALWLGFEYEFSSAIHLLCPQVEHIVRVKLKNAGEHTTRTDNGIEHEIGLSSLTNKAKFLDLFDELSAFEIKAIFTENLGCNFRNDVAHGLLNDDDGQSYYAVYAWWYVLRMICHSLVKSE